MKTSIILIGMISLGFLNVSQAANAKQTSFNYQLEKEQLLATDSLNQNFKGFENTSDADYIFNPSTVIPVAQKTIEDVIREDNQIIDSKIETDPTVFGLTVKTINQIIQEDVQITEAVNLDFNQPLDFEAINNSTNCFVEFQNKCSLKQENIKL
ncbi:hypothetical protein [Flavobacterium capsici]|uniref:Uncharacterized protein n=1 Tax=Flavobacterium capsici TaxID=3075618 RepID=A0AA96J108_9FLAO|nr:MULTISPECIES: hypothetical protein [unclassified Flavobacterium]WNM17772.1 hypothetical protein RN608_07070 [Flavobacterium sp. PMR2A8]WNM21825.1 hypothetical protein RN605_00370 [Flavobacterium sp. PMTSA4]